MRKLKNPYPKEFLDPDDDDGTMVNNVASFEESVVGHRIVKVEMKQELEAKDTSGYLDTGSGIEITLDNGQVVKLIDTSDCCAHTNVEDFLLHHNRIDHIITGVGTSDGYTTWHVFADFGDVMEMKVSWSCGNPFYYGYGFVIAVEETPEYKQWLEDKAERVSQANTAAEVETILREQFRA